MDTKPTIQEYWASVYANKKELSPDQIHEAIRFSKNFDMELIISTDIIILRNRAKPNAPNLHQD